MFARNVELLNLKPHTPHSITHFIRWTISMTLFLLLNLSPTVRVRITKRYVFTIGPPRRKSMSWYRKPTPPSPPLSFKTAPGPRGLVQRRGWIASRRLQRCHASASLLPPPTVGASHLLFSVPFPVAPRNPSCQSPSSAMPSFEGSNAERVTFASYQPYRASVP